RDASGVGRSARDAAERVMRARFAYATRMFHRRSRAAIGAIVVAVSIAGPAVVGAEGQAIVAYPQRPPADPATVERGKALYSVNCALCHGADARGAQGPSLIRSEIVLKDQKGELMADVVRQG